MAVNEFESCLLKIESADPTARQEAVLDLRRFPEPRALAVLQSLANDADPVVRDFAAEGASGLARAGVRLRRAAEEPLREVVSLESPLEVADEVFCIFRRNAAAIMAAALLAGTVKLLVGGIFLLSPFLFDSVRPLEDSLTGMGPFLVIIHQLVFRPFAWLTVGRAFMAGFPDPAVRQQSRVVWQSWEYWAFLPANLVQAIPVCAAAVVMLMPGRPDDLILLRTAALIFLAWFAYASIALLPMQLVHSGRSAEAVGHALRFYWSRGKAVRSLMPTFLLYLGLLYLLLFLNFRMFWPIDLSFTVIQSIGCILVADVLLDPFWIGFRILVTRLVGEREA
ncbi:MAG: HEAT repeat domain-containing protein [Candidatus Riflebacteria bacterium]|nr:HEAT repeat domain-containing protein [Candidatus Riflebacteria bacterium]